MTAKQERFRIRKALWLGRRTYQLESIEGWEPDCRIFTTPAEKGLDTL